MMVVTTATPALPRSLGGDVGDLEWTVNAYLLALACLLLTASGLGDRFGRRRIFALGLAGFAVSSVATALVFGVALVALVLASPVAHTKTSGFVTGFVHAVWACVALTAVGGIAAAVALLKPFPSPRPQSHQPVGATATSLTSSAIN